MPKVVREKEMAVSQGALFRAITDFDAYPKFLPEVVAVKTAPPKADRQRVVFELEIIKRFSYTLEFEMRGQEEVKWSLVESNIFKMNQGKWALRSLEGRRTHVEYEVEVAFGFLVPGWVTKKLTETSLPKMFESFESQARQYEGGAS